MRRNAGNGLAVEPDVALGRRVDAGNQVEQRSLAGPVRPDNRIHQPAINGEADVLHRLDAAKRDRKIVDFEQRHQRSPCPLLPKRSISVGTRPRGMKIMQNIRMAPNTTVSQPSNVDSACGSAVSRTAPISEP